MKKLSIIALVVAVLAGGLSLYNVLSPKPVSLGGQYNTNKTYFNAGLEASGDITKIDRFVMSGAVTSYTATATITATEVCNSSVLKVTPAAGAATITLPTATLLNASCLSANGDAKLLNVINGSGTTSTVFAAGSSGTLLYSSSSTIAAGKAALLRIVRDTATTYKAFLINLPN